MSGYAFVGLLVKDSLIGRNFSPIVFQTAWFGSSPQNVTGRDNTPGATRTFTGGTSVGTYTFVERVGRSKEIHVDDHLD